MNKMHRAQILLEPDQHQKLAEIAQQEGTSISEIVRTAVQEWLDERKDDEFYASAWKTWNWLTSIDKPSWPDVKANHWRLILQQPSSR